MTIGPAGLAHEPARRTSAVGIGIGMHLAYAATRQAGLIWTWPDPEVYAYASGGVSAAS